MGSRKLTANQYDRFLHHGIIGTDTPNISVAKHVMTAQEHIYARKALIKQSQIKYKTPKHGDEHGLERDETTGKIAKSDKNAIIVRDDLIRIAKDPNSKWYKDGTYQCFPNGQIKEVVHIYVEETRFVALYEKLGDGRNSYLSGFSLTEKEAQHFQKTNGELLTENVLKSLDQCQDPEIPTSIEQQLNEVMSSVDTLECLEDTNQKLPQTIKIQENNNNQNNGLQ